MNNYMIFDKGIEIPLLARNGVWEFVFNGQNWRMDRSVEQLMAYHIFIGNDANIPEVSALLQANYKRLSSATIEKLVLYFKKTHPIKNIQQYSFKDIPIYAEEDCPLYIANGFSYEISLTPKDEGELHEILKCSDDPWMDLIGWFYLYIEKYSLSPRYKRDIDIQYEELASNFCMQCGIDPAMFWTKKHYGKYQTKEPSELRLSASQRWWIRHHLQVKVVVSFILSVCVLILGTELEFGLLGGILVFAGLAGISATYNYLKNGGK